MNMTSIPLSVRSFAKEKDKIKILHGLKINYQYNYINLDRIVDMFSK